MYGRSCEGQGCGYGFSDAPPAAAPVGTREERRSTFELHLLGWHEEIFAARYNLDQALHALELLLLVVLVDALPVDPQADVLLLEPMLPG